MRRTRLPLWQDPLRLAACIPLVGEAPVCAHESSATRWLRALSGAAAVACACTNLTLAAATAETGTACAGLEPGPARTVTRVLDGETVALDDGTELRLIGALAPRAVDADAEAWPAEAAATEALRV